MCTRGGGTLVCMREEHLIVYLIATEHILKRRKDADRDVKHIIAIYCLIIYTNHITLYPPI